MQITSEPATIAVSINHDNYTNACIEKTGTTKWVCGICGYEYDGDVPFEELPDDFTCPLCKQPKSVFKKVD